VLLHSPKRKCVRRVRAVLQALRPCNTPLAAAGRLGAVDVYYAGEKSSLRVGGRFVPDRVPVSVYENLIVSVRKNLPAVHHYYDVRRRKMRLKDIHIYDTYVPILSDLQRAARGTKRSNDVKSTRAAGRRVLRAVEKRF